MRADSSGPSGPRSRATTSARSPVAPSASSVRGGRNSNSEPTKDELYERAKQVGVEGRSKMTKEQLKRALGRKRG